MKHALYLIFFICFVCLGNSVPTARQAAFFAPKPAVGGGGGGGSAFPSDSIVVNWKLNGDTTDSSGNGNNGTAHGTTSYVADETGAASHAISMDGSTAYVDAGSSSVANFTSGDFSVVTWFTNTAADYANSPILWGNDVFGNAGYFLDLHVAFGGDTLAAEPTFTWHESGGDFTISGTDRTVGLTPNCCLVFVRNGTSGKIYVNGTDVTQAAQHAIGTIATSTTKFTVGKYLGNSNFLKANVQQVIVYSRALTPTEVTNGSAGTSQ